MLFVDLGVSPDELVAFYATASLYEAPTGFGTGGATPADLERYGWYGLLLEQSGVSKDGVLVDVGCGKGTFLETLRQRGFARVHGVDVDPRLVEIGRSGRGLSLAVGSAETIPHADGALDAVTSFHVLEHLDDVGSALREVARVLRPGGVFLVEVPDASKYAAERVFDFFWVGMKEHVNHFTPTTLREVLGRHGLRVTSMRQTRQRIFGEFHYPSLSAVCSNDAAHPHTPEAFDADGVRSFVDHVRAETARSEERAVGLRALLRSGRPVSCWGISQEFFNLRRFADLDPMRLCALYDRSALKAKLTVAGLPIAHPDGIPMDSSELTLVLTSAFHGPAMERELIRRGFRGSVHRIG
jgi:SAM-dependent methyltransferase